MEHAENKKKDVLDEDINILF